MFRNNTFPTFSDFPMYAWLSLLRTVWISFWALPQSWLYVLEWNENKNKRINVFYRIHVLLRIVGPCLQLRIIYLFDIMFCMCTRCLVLPYCSWYFTRNFWVHPLQAFPQMFFLGVEKLVQYLGMQTIDNVCYHNKRLSIMINLA